MWNTWCAKKDERVAVVQWKCTHCAKHKSLQVVSLTSWRHNIAQEWRVNVQVISWPASLHYQIRRSKSTRPNRDCPSWSWRSGLAMANIHRGGKWARVFMGARLDGRVTVMHRWVPWTGRKYLPRENLKWSSSASHRQLTLTGGLLKCFNEGAFISSSMFRQQQLGRGKDRGRSRKDISGNPWPRECRWCKSEKLRLTLLILRWNLDVLKPTDVKTVLKSSCKEGIMTNLKYRGRHIIHSLWRWKKIIKTIASDSWPL